MAPGIVPGGRCIRCVYCGPAGECRDGKAFKSGRCGDWVWYVQRSQQWRRRWLKPFDPKSAKQQAWRARLAAASKAYSEELSQEERAACVAAGAKRRTRPRLARSGRQTGQLYWVGKECSQKPPGPAPKPDQR